jgi:enterochelin esterase-like enzyme
LIAEGRIRPIALALVEHGDQARFVEYACSEATVAFLERAVLPLAHAELDLIAPDESPGAFGVLGASMGGLISLYTALRLPHVFGRVLSQSGGFGFDLAGREPFILDYARMRRETSLKIWMDVGRFESLLEPNRRMRAALDGAGYDVSYREYAGGHNYTAWRDDVVAGLEALFGARDGDAR